MLVLFETAAGFALFKLLSKKKLKCVDNLYEDFETIEKATNVVQMAHFQKFKDMSEALTACNGLIDSELSRPLKRLLKKVDASEKLALVDAKLGSQIRAKYGLECVVSSSVAELVRCIRCQAHALLSPSQLELGSNQARDMQAMRLGLAHSVSRYKLKFSTERVDTMLVQAVSLLDELDKELNNYVMRAREWYGWHFPELSHIVPDNMTYVQLVQKLGIRTNAANLDLSDLLPDDIVEKVKHAAEISMGTEITSTDMMHIHFLCTQISDLLVYRTTLHDYLVKRMLAVSPNLSVLVGEIVGARLIAQAGSLMNLAKYPASTVQILGAEKALFRALKTKHSTPKYGLIYHSQFVTQAKANLKGKASRMLATKASLACRVDALSENVSDDVTLGADHRAKLESRLRWLERGGAGKSASQISGLSRSLSEFDRYTNKSSIKRYADYGDSFPNNSINQDLDETEPSNDNLLDGSYVKEENPSKRIKINGEDDSKVGFDNNTFSNSIKKKKKKKSKEPSIEDVTES